jgi:hypothetical protein
MPAEIQRSPVPHRAGEWREPIVVTLEREPAQVFARECSDSLVDHERAYALLVERRLLLDDVAESDVDVDAARTVLSAAARDATVTTALDGVAARYVRSFARPAPTARFNDRFIVALPVRIHARATGLAPAVVAAPDAVPEAVAWERASAACGRTMAEWAFLVLLRAGFTRGSRAAAPARRRPGELVDSR